MAHKLLSGAFAGFLFVLLVIVPLRISSLKTTRTEISESEMLLISLANLAKSTIGVAVLLSAFLVYAILQIARRRA